MRVPGTDAFVATTSVRGPGLGIATMMSRGVVTDWGLQARLVSYIARQTRTQLSIVLAGRGYFAVGSETRALRVGSAVLSDQRLHGDEGYAGSPSMVLIVDWEPDDVMGPRHAGPPSIAQLGASDVARLRAHVSRWGAGPACEWASELIELLRALGLPAPRSRARALPTSPGLARLYAALADVRTHLHEYPALGEIAGAVEMSERHVRRAFERLDRELGTGTNGWRDFLADTRLATAQQLLSVPGTSVSRVASLAGFRSPVALCHAFAERGGGTPGALARALRERWELPLEVDDARAVDLAWEARSRASTDVPLAAR